VDDPSAALANSSGVEVALSPEATRGRSPLKICKL
jgi:hypothetical protein